MTLQILILAGGSGTRLWPASRESFPKQFLKLSGDKTLYQQALLRAAQIPNSNIQVYTRESYRFIAAEQAREIGITIQIIVEPSSRNTALPIACAAIAAQAIESTQLLVLAADHIIVDTNAFLDAVEIARQAENSLITFGIKPTRPEIAFGYLKPAGSPQKSIDSVLAFIEKPNKTKAEQLIIEGCYWNSGMFLFPVTRLLSEIKQHNQNIFNIANQSWQNRQESPDFIRLSSDIWNTAPDISIDYALMEKTAYAGMVTLEAGWNDAGSWNLLHELNHKPQEARNALTGDVIIHQTENSTVYASHRLVATVGVKDHVIIETADAVLVAHQDAVQDIKHVVATLKKLGRSEAQNHQLVYRPWGSYESVICNDRFQVKRIMVKPGESLSLQLHYHRAEHWIIVKGTAKITIDDHEFLLHEDQSTYVPLGSKHRLVNPGKIILEMIEVQTGSYVGEDDIVRFEDIYGRVE